MRVLAIDPGMTTGIACYGNAGELEFSMTVTQGKLLANGFMNKLMAMAMPEMVLIEDIPSHTPDRLMADFHGQLVRWFRIAGFSYEIVRPAQWKGLVERVEIPGQHARDAATMGKWWIKRSNG